MMSVILQNNRAKVGLTVASTTLFIDYQNMYRSARDAFGWRNEPSHFGNFRPEALASQLQGRNHTLEIDSIRIYTGVHTPQRNSHQNAVMNRRMSAWVADAPDRVEVFPRPLAYRGREAREKGVDVELAIDIVALALEEKFDALVLASADTDLVPALDLVATRFPEKRIVTLGYTPEPGFDNDAPAPIDITGGGAQRRFIPKRDFELIVDRRNFNESQSDASDRIDPDRWNQIRSRTRQ